VTTSTSERSRRLRHELNGPVRRRCRLRWPGRTIALSYDESAPLSYDEKVSRVPGRATSLASVGLLLAFASVAVALGVPSKDPAHSATQKPTGVTQPSPRRGSGPQGPGATDATVPGGQSVVGNAVTQSFRCPTTTSSDGKQATTSELTSSEPGLPSVTATTFCDDSNWYLSESVDGVAAKAFRVPDDPPIPPAVPVERFIPLRTGDLPAVLVLCDDLGSAQLYELFTLSGKMVDPLNIVPGSSPVLLVRSSSVLQGSGFTCTTTPSGEQISQYEWYVVNPTTLKTGSQGEILGDPAVFLQTTVYSATGSDSVKSSTLPIAQVGYTSVRDVGTEAC
jgi:hypothetical protein